MDSSSDFTCTIQLEELRRALTYTVCICTTIVFEYDKMYLYKVVLQVEFKQISNEG